MAERRSLTEGLKASPTTSEAEAIFVFGTKPKPPQPREVESTGPIQEASRIAARISLTTRVRADLAGRLKRISLERQLAGSQPNSLQDIVEAALDQWLAHQSELT